MIIGLPTATDDNNNNVGLKIIAYRAICLSVCLFVCLSVQGGVGGGHWGPNCKEPALGGPSLQKVENPCSRPQSVELRQAASSQIVHLN